MQSDTFLLVENPALFGKAKDVRSEGILSLFHTIYYRKVCHFCHFSHRDQILKGVTFYNLAPEAPLLVVGDGSDRSDYEFTQENPRVLHKVARHAGLTLAGDRSDIWEGLWRA